MNRIIKIIIFICLAAFLFLGKNLFAIGNFSVGINTGATYDPNYLQNDINTFNKEIEYQKATVPGTSGTQMDVPYSFLFGTNFRYQFNYLLFRLGGYYTKPYGGTEGSFTSGGVKNKIHITTYQASFPLSLGFMLPIKEKGNFFIGCGVTYHISSVKITQSNPTAGPFLVTDPECHMRDSYYAIFPGWHIIVGTEVPLSDRYSICVEWIHQEGRSQPVKNDGLDSTGASTSLPKRTLNARGDFILFGVNYYISI